MIRHAVDGGDAIGRWHRDARVGRALRVVDTRTLGFARRHPLDRVVIQGDFGSTRIWEAFPVGDSILFGIGESGTRDWLGTAIGN